MRHVQALVDKAMSEGYLLLSQELGKETKHAARDVYFAKCAENRPYVVVAQAGSYATVTMDTYCFDIGDLDDQACADARALFVNIAKDREFTCGRNYFMVKRVPVEYASTLANALMNVALRSASRPLGGNQ